MQKMTGPRVLFFMLRLEKETEQLTGGTLSTLHILKNLRYFEPYVILNARDLLARELERHQIPYEVLEGHYPWDNFGFRGILGRVRTLSELISFQSRMRKVIARVDPAIVHCDEMGASMIFAVARLGGKKLVMYVRNSPRNGKLKAVYRIPMFFADAVVAISRELAEVVSELGGDAIRSKTVHIYNAVDMDEIVRFIGSEDRELLRGRLSVPPGCVAIGIVAAIEKRKRQLEFLTEVVREFKNRNVVFYFLGGIKETDYQGSCFAAVSRLGIENAVFPGFVHDMFPWYIAMDIVCLPSDREGVPRALIEASAFGLPVVAFDIPGCREAVVEGETGYLVSTFEDFSARLEELVANPELREELGSKGERHVRSEFDVAGNTERLERLYQRLLGACDES